MKLTGCLLKRHGLFLYSMNERRDSVISLWLCPWPPNCALITVVAVYCVSCRDWEWGFKVLLPDASQALSDLASMNVTQKDCSKNVSRPAWIKPLRQVDSELQEWKPLEGPRLGGLHLYLKLLLRSTACLLSALWTEGYRGKDLSWALCILKSDLLFKKQTTRNSSWTHSSPSLVSSKQPGTLVIMWALLSRENSKASGNSHPEPLLQVTVRRKEFASQKLGEKSS